MRNFQINWSFLLFLRVAQFSIVLSEKSPQVHIDESNYEETACNTTIILDETLGDAWKLFRLPSVKPPFLCSWHFETKDKRPFQMEVHQLKNIGRWDPVNKTCIDGFVQFSEKDGISKTATKLCDDKDQTDETGTTTKTNKSYNHISTPFYAARGVLWVHVVIPKKASAELVPKLNLVATVAPLMMDFPLFHFPQVPVGGTFLKKSDCHILFTQCAEEECFISSENYPGVQMNNGGYHYIFRTSKKTDRIRMTFQMSVANPIDCNTDFISISSSLNSTSLSKDEKELTRICEESSTVEIEAISDIIVQYHSAIEKPFRSGLRSGTFSGRIRFIHEETGNFQAPEGKAWRAYYREKTFDRGGNFTGRKFEFTHENFVQFSRTGTGDGAVLAPISNRQIPLKAELISTVFCGDEIDGKIHRAGRFQLLLQPPQKLEWKLLTSENKNFNCLLSFSGHKFDALSLRICINDFYKVERTKKELFYLNDKDRSKSKNQEPAEVCQDLNTLQNFNSSSEFSFQMKLNQPLKNEKPTDLKYVQGTFIFHDQKTEGYFPNSSTKNTVIFKDGKVSSRGQLLGPAPLLFLNSPLGKTSSKSSAVLIPGKNRLLRLELKRASSYAEYLDLRPGKTYCHSLCSTSCGCKIYGTTEVDNGTTLDLDSFDRISLQVGLGLGDGEEGREKEISCFCGLAPETSFKIYSDTPLRVNYHMTNENYLLKSEIQSEMTYAAQYEFLDEQICPQLPLIFDPEEQMGVMLKPKLGKDGNLWSFQCTWDFVVYPRTTTQLFLTAVGNGDEVDVPCQFPSWNMSISFYISKLKGWSTRETFCSEDKFKEINFPSLARKVRLMMTGLVTYAPEIWLNWTASEIKTETEVEEEKEEIKMGMTDSLEFDWRVDAIWSGLVALGILLLWTFVIFLVCCVSQRNRNRGTPVQPRRKRDESREKIQGFERPENTVIYTDDRYY